MRVYPLFRKVIQPVLFGVLATILLFIGASIGYAQEDLGALGVSEDSLEDDMTEESVSEDVLEDTLGEVSENESPSDTADDFDTEEQTEEKGIHSQFVVTPVVANEKAKPRDILKKELLITNTTGRRIDLYISVENIDPTTGAEEFVSPSVSDLSTSLANWIEITRGVIELSAGESRKIPYLIHVNLSAKPGSYFARIQFREGSRRSEAKVHEDGTSLMLNLEVLDDAREHLQLGNFISDDSLVLGSSVSFSYALENVGNRMLEPRGSIRIFNRRGEEVGSIPLNAEGKEINPNNKAQLAAAWNAEGRFGKYKAFLDLEYGESQLASVQDTLYFWVFPWKEVLATLFGVLVLALLGTYIVHMRSLARPSYAGAVYTAPEPDPDPVPVDIPATAAAPRSLEQNLAGSGPTVLAKRSASRQAEATVVAAPHSETVKLPSPAPVRHGATVELSPRSAHSGPVQHGNTVELSPRR